MLVCIHFRDGAAERTQLLFQAGAIDRDFAGVVDQAVEQVGADAHLFLRRARADVVVVARQHVGHRRLAYHYAGTNNVAKAVAYLTRVAEKAARNSAMWKPLLTSPRRWSCCKGFPSRRSATSKNCRCILPWGRR